jgi:hypothetical protein
VQSRLFMMQGAYQLVFDSLNNGNVEPQNLKLVLHFSRQVCKWEGNVQGPDLICLRK